MEDVTRILRQVEEGIPQAAEQLLPLIYNELRRLAAHKMSGEKPGHTLQATALVHDAYLRLVNNGGEIQWESRRHFFAAAADAMRLILIDRARVKSRIKNGGEFDRVELIDVPLEFSYPDAELLALNDALAKLAIEDQCRNRV